MTISTTASRISYNGNGATTAFAFPYRFFANGDLVVILVATDGTETTQILGTNYTVTGADSDSGGTVTMTVAPTFGQKLVIYRDLALTQEVDYISGDPFPAETHERALDRLTLISQQINEETDRAIKAPVTDPTTIDMTLAGAAARANTFMYFDSNGEPAYAPVGTTGSPSAITRQRFSGDDVTTVFNLAADPGASGASVVVYIGGLYQQVNTYSITGAVLTFTEAPPAGTENIEVVQYAVTNIGETDASQVSYTPAGTGAVATNVQSKLREEAVSVLDFMSDAKRNDVLNRTGLFDHSAEVLAAANFAISVKKALYCPAGLYNYGVVGTTRASALAPTIPNGGSVHIFGDGPGLTVFKEAAGQNAIIGRFDSMWTLSAPDGVTADSIIFRDMTLDKNGASNGTPPSPFDWEQSHCLIVSTGATSGRIKSVVIENVETLDKVGGGIVFSAGAIENAVITNCHGRNFGGLVGARADLEFQASVGQLTVTGCSGPYVQSEPNVTLPFSGVRPNALFVGCQYGTFDLIGYDGDQDIQTFTLIGCDNGTAGDLWVRYGVLNIQNSRIRVQNVTDWRNATSRISDTTIVIAHNTGTDTFLNLNISGTSLVKQDHVFENCRFVSDSTASATTTGYAVINSAAMPAGSNFKVVLRDCTFDPVFQYTANCYRAGTWVFERCRLSSRSGGWAIQAGGDASFVCDVTLDSCDLSQVAGQLVRIAAAGASAWVLRFKGVMDYSKFAMGNRPATEYQDTKVVHEGYWVSDSRPAAGGLNGQIVKLRRPTPGSASEFVVSTGSITAATFRMAAQAGISRNTTANRPTPNANDIGLQYLDTTLDADGKPIWWNGTAWVDATGLVV